MLFIVLSPTQALQLCWAVYQFHFQFLVFLGSYVKLLDVFYTAKQTESVSVTAAHLYYRQSY